MQLGTTNGHEFTRMTGRRTDGVGFGCVITLGRLSGRRQRNGIFIRVDSWFNWLVTPGREFVVSNALHFHRRRALAALPPEPLKQPVK